MDLEKISLLLQQRRPGHALPGELYNDADMFAFDLAAIYERNWIMAGFESELPEPGSTLALNVGRSPIVLVRGRDETVRGFFNSCRHRGAQICATGASRRPRLVCPYHQWAYELDGRLVHAPQMQMPFDPDLLSLRPVHTKCVAGALFVCLADSPPEFGGFAAALEPLLAAHDMRHTRVAAQSTEIWHANWKLVMENARECYHCMAGHPDLCVTLPVKRRSLPLAEQFRITAPFTERMAERGLPVGPDQGPWWQVARYPLNIGAVSLSLDGQPPVSRPMGRLGDGDVGTLRWSIDPHCFVHAVGDHVFMFSAMPTGPHQTLVTSKWLVHENAVEGTDYQLDVLTALWTRTNDQDRSLVEINQAGVNSLGYVPGPYCATAEQFLVRFVDWYCQTAALFIQERRQSPGRQAA